MSECDTNSNKESCDSSAKKPSDCCTFAEDMVCLAKQAKKELLKEKMKAVYEEKLGEKMDKVAALAVDAALACMQHQMAGKEACDTYKADLLAVIKS